MRKTSPNNPLDVSYTTIQMKLNKQNMREFLTHFCETVKGEVNITKYLLKPKTFALQGERKMLEALKKLEQGCRNLAVISYTDLIGNYRALAKDLAQSFNQSLVILKQGNKSCDVAGDPIEHEHLQEGGNESDYDLAEYYNECIAKTLILESTTNVKESDGQDSVSMCPRASVRETISLIYNIGFAAANAGKQCFGLSTAWKNCISSIYESEETCLHIPDYLRSDYLCCNADSSISNPSLSHNIYIPYDPGLIL